MGFIVKFIRSDLKPNEDYFYNDKAAAEYHLNLFRDDDSGLYSKIELIDASPAGDVVDMIVPEVNENDR